MWVKDESDRFGLPAFKFLGASWALDCLLREAPGLQRVATATDGNHGRAVARMATSLGLRSTVYVPVAMTAARRAAIAGEGAAVVDVDGSYDQAVATAAADADADPVCGVMNDADLDGTSPVARWVIEGYSTLFSEVDAQLGDAEVDVVMLQTGVGAFAAAGVRWAARRGAAAIAVDPAGAACVAASLAAGRPTVVETTGTAMAGLDAGTPSTTAWPSLEAGLAGAVVVTDDEADDAMRALAAAGIESGESGAAGLAGLRALLTDGACAPLRETIGRPRTALVVVTEGATDPERYQRVVGEREGSVSMNGARAHHVGITVGNLERAIEFFTLLLGCDPTTTFHRVDMPFLDEITGYDNIDMRFAFFALPGDHVQVELIEYRRPAAGTVDQETYNIGSTHICIQVDDIDAEFARLSAAGVEFRSTRPVETPPGPLGGSRWLYLRAPEDGYTIELCQI